MSNPIRELQQIIAEENPTLRQERLRGWVNQWVECLSASTYTDELFLDYANIDKLGSLESQRRTRIKGIANELYESEGIIETSSRSVNENGYDMRVDDDTITIIRAEPKR